MSNNLSASAPRLDEAAEKKTCFVIMGFGKKVDFETGNTFDLDMTYHNLIKPAVEAAGVECIRADEITHAGVIDVPMYERILSADLVVADISTGNRNAIYELGVRHALRPQTTIIIGEDSNKTIPFDLNHVVIRKYHHLGEDIGSTEARTKGKELTDAIKELLAAHEPKADSPVYTFIPNLQRPGLATAAPGVVAALAAASATPPPVDGTQSALMTLARDAQTKGDFATAKNLLTTIVTVAKNQVPARPVDVSILQQLALVTYKSRQPTPLEALRAGCAILAELEPDTTNDTETLGLWGAVHKRLWQLTRDRTSLDGAVRALGRGFYIRNDYYNGINFAYMLNERAVEQADPAEATADFILARRVRREVRDIAEAWWKEASKPGSDQPRDKVYWALATLSEASLGLGDEEGCKRWLDEAKALKPAPPKWIIESSETQLASLRQLLDKATAKGIPPPARSQGASGSR
ncbi:MAG: tetratricopeptide repeat-containing protein [Chthoniobacterales bacterium]